MKKYIWFLILPFIALALTACDKDDVTPMNLDLLAGTWEVVVQGSQNVFTRQDYLDIITSPEPIHGSYGGLQGNILTYLLTATGRPIHDKAYSWTITEMEGNYPLLDVVFEAEADSDNNADAGHTGGNKYSYKIIRLDDSYMWLQVNTNDKDNVIRFHRRTIVESN